MNFPEIKRMSKKGMGFEDLPAWAIWLFLIIFFTALSYYVYTLIMQQIGK